MFEAGRAAQVEKEMFQYNLDIMGVSESHWTGCGALTTGSGNNIVYSGRDGSEHREGVAIMMTKVTRKSLIEWKSMNSRLNFSWILFKIFEDIQCDAPTNETEEKVKDSFTSSCRKRETERRDMICCW